MFSRELNVLERQIPEIYNSYLCYVPISSRKPQDPRIAGLPAAAGVQLLHLQSAQLHHVADRRNGQGALQRHPAGSVRLGSGRWHHADQDPEHHPGGAVPHLAGHTAGCASAGHGPETIVSVV